MKNNIVFTSFITQFEAVARRYGTCVAVCEGEQVITYRELNQRANQLAHYLMHRGIGPEMVVGINMKCSIAMILAILAIWKARAAYMGLVFSDSTERSQWMLDEAKPSLILCQQEPEDSVLLQTQNWLVLPTEMDQIELYPKSNPNVLRQASQLAYVLYTSGSSGKPKGVMVEQGNLAAALSNWSQAYQLQASDVHLQMANHAFDVFIGDLVRALGKGSKLVLCPKSILLNPQKLFQMIVEQQITVAEFIPAILRRLSDYMHEHAQTLTGLRLLISGSDNITVKDMLRLQQVCGNTTKLINSYGLTETTIDSTYYSFAQQECYTASNVAIGKPLPHVQVYILDKQLSQVLPGEVGEIYIGGLGIARGYLNDPKQTSSRFISIAWLQDTTTRLYKTGDLGRYLPDGNIEHLGRIDNQFKANGVRIEPAEIEMAILNHPDVKECVIVRYVDDVTKKTKLAAYITTYSKEMVDPVRLRQFLKGKIFSQMIPDRFITVLTLPLTANHKIDRGLLRNLVDRYAMPQHKSASPTHWPMKNKSLQQSFG